jgi:hypothetical protein
MMPRSKTVCVLLAALCGAMSGRIAFADDAADTAAARRLGSDGLNLADSGNCDQAIEKLRRAEELHHAPTTAARLGECEIEVGQVVVGTERLQRLLREPLAVDAPAPFVDAITGARTALEHARPRIAAIRIEVKAQPGAKYQVTVDGEPVSEALIGDERPSDPGRHKVEASGPGLLTVARDINLGEGEGASVSLELLPIRAVAAPTEKRVIAAPTPPNPHARPNHNPAAIVALSVGGLGLATGIAMAIATGFDSADLSKSCNTNNECPASKGAELSAAKTWATVSTVGFAVAGAGLGTGLLLLMLPKRESEVTSEARVHPLVGPLYLGCAGTF